MKYKWQFFLAVCFFASYLLVSKGVPLFPVLAGCGFAALLPGVRFGASVRITVDPSLRSLSTAVPIGGVDHLRLSQCKDQCTCVMLSLHKMVQALRAGIWPAPVFGHPPAVPQRRLLTDQTI